MKMDAEKARKLAFDKWFFEKYFHREGSYRDYWEVWNAACTAEVADCEARVQAERKGLMEVLDYHKPHWNTEGYICDCGFATRGHWTEAYDEWLAHVHSLLGPTDALDAKLRQARLEEAELWDRASLRDDYGKWAPKRLAALKGT